MLIIVASISLLFGLIGGFVMGSLAVHAKVADQQEER